MRKLIGGAVLACALALAWLPATAQDRAGDEPSAPASAEPSATAAVACAVPFAAGRVTRAVPPRTPLAALQQTPSGLLNAATLQAARDSTYATRIVNCRPVAEQYLFTASFRSSTPSGTFAPAVAAPAAPAAPPSISTYFIGTWYCSTELGSHVVKAFGLIGNGSILALNNAYVTADNVLAYSVDLYTQSGSALRVFDHAGGYDYSGTSPGWANDTLVFTGTAVPAGAGLAGVTPDSLDQRMTYVRADGDRFQRTFETKPVNGSAWTITSRETCARIEPPALPAAAPKPLPF